MASETDIPPAPPVEVPATVKDFVFDLHQSCRHSQRPDEMKSIYSGAFIDLSQSLYSSSPWPSSPLISSECENDSLFLTFYDELTTRHMFKNLRPTLSDKVAAWHTYAALFDKLLALDGDTKGDKFHVLPEWAFEIMHEYVYQFQGFCQARTQLNQRTEAELKLLKDNEDVWTVGKVMGHLHGLIAAAGLKADPSGQSAHGQSLHIMGYFASLSLSRLECLLGDYHGSLSALSSISFNEKNDTHRGIFAAGVSVSYHAGVSYVAMGRYRDAAKVFADKASAINKGTQQGYLKRLSGYDQISKTQDKMLAFLAIIQAVDPAVKVDDPIAKMTHQAYGDKISRVVAGEETFEELFSFACPKFVSPVVPDYGTAGPDSKNLSAVAYARQVKCCVADLQPALKLAKIRSYLKLYTSIPISKLAQFCDTSPEAMSGLILSLKATTLQPVYSGYSRSPLNFSSSSSAPPSTAVGDVSFRVSDGCVHVEPTQKGEARTHRFFLDNVRGARELREEIGKIPEVA